MDARLKDAYAQWLRSMRWDFWASPSFKYPKEQAEAVAAIKQWLAPKAPAAYAVVAYERGPLGGRLHCHAFIGGVGKREIQRRHLEKSWRRGLIEVKPYSPRLGGIEYVLKVADDPDGWELIGTPVPYKAKRRGTRGGKGRHRKGRTQI